MDINITKNAPVVLFIYNRFDHTERTLSALSANTLAQYSDLYIYADGPKENASIEQIDKIKKTRDIAKSKKWCKNVTVIESEKNKGLAASIISGVTDIINKYGKVIVLEDDIVTGKYFLEFMNNALDKYKEQKEVWHISGWRDPVDNTVEGNSYFYPTMDCWGWATWADRWQYYKKDALYYKSVFTEEMKYHFDIEGTAGNWSQIEENIEGKINTWAIFWYATIYLKNGLCLGPSKSIVKNIGLDNSGVHTGESPMQIIKDSIDFKTENFPETIIINKKEYNKNVRFYSKMNNISNFSRSMKLFKIRIKKLIKKN